MYLSNIPRSTIYVPYSKTYIRQSPQNYISSNIVEQVSVTLPTFGYSKITILYVNIKACVLIW